ncbi:kinesin-like protein KIN-10C [Vigna unguiculata]|uniref:kinesin-like protein KIN-10C n=1 Tax=Vigna unguiculata TaxID=3917 RepID=UPI0010167C84|nr:kinesin-like protein KIN-10C [Vigna unguiculata]XP_027923403.1 kinesin-like protein KIN-10C [Vigna unguiculata]XP_027923404.1 kinesin-like protein KIN-10C [Vigna unguiculata]
MVSKQIDRVGGKVRVVARIRGFSGPEANSESGTARTVEWISVNGENSDDVSISFRDHPSRYLVDYCYKEDEDSEMIYSREVKPFVSAAFEGHNSTVIAHGARGSGKTHIIQGSVESPGLAVLAVAEFLSIAEKNGKSINVSLYEIDHQERAMDLLNPENPPISVFEDRGRIQFKGLTQVPVRSVSEFQNLYSTACFSFKGAPKKGVHRSHMGLIVHVVSQNVGSIVSKMNFVDLAGYEDTRKKTSDGSCLTEISKINKSIYALLNICHALSTNESHIPYRESKLTRILQDSLRGTSRILLVSCLNPSFCQDTIYMLSLASRSCHRIHHQTFLDSTKKSVSSANMRQIPKSVSGTAKKLHGSSKPMKGRKLFDEASHSTPKVKKEMVTEASKPLMDNSLPETGNHDNSGVETIVNNLALTNVSFTEDDFAKASQDMKLDPTLENGDSSLNASSEVEFSSLAAKDILVDGDDGKKEHTPCINHSSEPLSIIVHEGHNSPPISSQLRDLSNSLKMLCSSTSSCLQNSEKQPISVLEPKTPINKQNMNINQWNEMNGKSPWETFSMRGSGMKSSIVQEYLRFLNTADKEELKRLKGIGDKRANFILELRQESPEPFKSLNDLKDIGLSAKQIKGMMKKEVGELFSEL